LSHKMFAQVKEMMKSRTLTEAIGDGPSVGFMLPMSCPVKEPPACKLSEILINSNDLEGASQKEDKVPNTVINLSDT